VNAEDSLNWFECGLRGMAKALSVSADEFLFDALDTLPRLRIMVYFEEKVA
jgi:hypothetical protein